MLATARTLQTYGHQTSAYNAVRLGHIYLYEAKKLLTDFESETILNVMVVESYYAASGAQYLYETCLNW